jgi:hypothetical protein
MKRSAKTIKLLKTNKSQKTIKNEANRRIEKLYAINLKCVRVALHSQEDHPSKEAWKPYILSAKTRMSRTLKVEDTVENKEARVQLNPRADSPVKLLPASEATNIIYEVKGLTDADIHEINAVDGKNIINDRCMEIKRRASSIDYYDYGNSSFLDNLQGVDGDLPRIVAQITHAHYFEQCRTITDAISLIVKINKFTPLEERRYVIKAKRFLRSFALGMQPQKLWQYQDYEFDRFIFEGDPANFFFYYRTFFNDCLLMATRFEHRSTKRYNYLKLYKEKDTQGKLRTFLKLNLQMIVA